MVTCLVGVAVSSQNKMYDVSTLESMLKSSPQSPKNKSQSVSSKQPFNVSNASLFQVRMFFVIIPPVFNCDRYIGSSRMTLWSDRPRGGRGFEMYAPGIFPKYKSSVLCFLVGIVTYCSRLGRCVEISPVKITQYEFWLLSSLSDSSVKSFSYVLSR